MDKMSHCVLMAGTMEIFKLYTQTKVQSILITIKTQSKMIHNYKFKHYLVSLSECQAKVNHITWLFIHTNYKHGQH